MKSRNLIVALTISLMTVQAYAAFTETGDVATVQPAWKKMTTQVKVTVQSWYDYWMGKTPDLAPKPEQVAQTPKTGSPQESTPQPESKPATPAMQEPAAPQAQAAVTPEAARPALKKEVNEAANALKKQALFEEKAEGSSLKDIQSLRDSVKGASALQVSKAGRKGTSNLNKNKSGIPTIDWAKVKATKKVPKLDIGTENLISAKDFRVTKLNWSLAKPSDLKRLPTVAAFSEKEVKKALGQPVVKVLGARGLQANLRPGGQPITREVVDKVQYVIKPTEEVKPLPYKPLSDEHLKMVAALILFEKGNHCHMIMGLFHQLQQAKNTEAEATFHLGACADQLKMEQAAFDNLSKLVASEDKEFGKEALALLSKDLPIIYEKDFYKVMKSAKNPKSLITDESRDNVTYRMAKGAYRAGDFKTSAVWTDQVSEKSEFYDDARFLSAMNAFANGEKPKALKKLQALWGDLEARKVGNTNIRALTAVNLARMYFADKKYDKAFEHYMQVPKDHALWVQALIEQGWTQVALEDYSGAIGNMYSLHSPYFKAVYQPESFVVRTIGYLNICQYGDAYKTLTWLEHDYRDYYDKMSAYLTKDKTPVAVYNTVKGYIKGKSTDSVEGVPYQIWREMARRKDFLNLQTALNAKQDEARFYEGVNEKIKAEKASIRSRAESSKKQFDKWKTEIAKNKKGGKDLVQAEANLKLERDRTIGYRFQLSILEQSREGYLAFQKLCQGHLDKETTTLTARAGEILLKRANGMKTEMSRVLENNEFLRYEVFSGSGENIRYQVSGGNVSGEVSRIPASIKPTKMMNWSFDGEFWEDEIGSYRSSLQNACPKTANRVERQEGEQAHLSEENK